MARGIDEELIGIAASCVAHVADGCTVDLGVGGEAVCVAAAHVDVAAEARIAELARRDDVELRARAPLIGERGLLGTLSVWSARPLTPLAAAFVDLAARHAAAIVERRGPDGASKLAHEALLARLGHEVRGPLQALSIGVELMRTRARDTADEIPRQWIVERCDHGRRAIDRLTSLCDRLLDVSRLRAGTRGTDVKDVDLGSIVYRVVAAHADECAWAGCTVVVAGPERIEGRWDVVQVETILSNLVVNATKYAAGSEIHIEVSTAETEVTIAVRDHGPGIAGDPRPLFDRFVRGGTAATTSGLGLGLWIARELATLQRGRLSYEPTPGGGASFVVALPRDVTPAAAPSSVP